MWTNLTWKKLSEAPEGATLYFVPRNISASIADALTITLYTDYLEHLPDGTVRTGEAFATAEDCEILVTLTRCVGLGT